MMALDRPLSYSRLSRFIKSPPLFLNNEKQEETQAQRLGKAMHCAILEPGIFTERYCKDGPINPKTGLTYGLDSKAVKDFEGESGRIVLGADAWGLAESAQGAIVGHPIASNLLNGALKEIELHAEIAGLPCMGRLDALNIDKKEVVDLKTCADIDAFEADARRYHYAHQLAFYRQLAAGFLKTEPENFECFLVAVEKQKPFRSGVWRVSRVVLAQCMSELFGHIGRLKKCLASGCFTDGYEKVKDFDWI